MLLALGECSCSFRARGFYVHLFLARSPVNVYSLFGAGAPPVLLAAAYASSSWFALLRGVLLPSLRTQSVCSRFLSVFVNAVLHCAVCEADFRALAPMGNYYKNLYCTYLDLPLLHLQFLCELSGAIYSRDFSLG